MTEKEKNRLGYALVDLYILLFRSAYKKEPVVNRFKEHYNLMVVIDQFGFDKAKVLMEYYFTTPRAGHPINAFMNNYHELAVNMDRAAEDKERRERIRQETKERVEELNVRQQRTESN